MRREKEKVEKKEGKWRREESGKTLWKKRESKIRKKKKEQ